MPPAVGLVAAVAGYAATAALGTGLLASLGGFVVATAVNQLGSRAFGKWPKTSAFGADASGRIVQVRSSVESHKIIYGRARVSGPLAYVATAGDGAGPASPPRDNKMLHMVIALAGHEVEEIGDVYFNDQVLTIDPNGYVTSSPYYPGASYVFVQKVTGADDQAANAFMVSQVPNWTAAHRLRGVAYLYVRLEYSADIFPLGIPNISAVVKGKKVYDPRTGLTRWSDNAALCVRDYLASDYGFGCAPDEIADDYFIAAANTCEEAVATRPLDCNVGAVDPAADTLALNVAVLPFAVGDRVTVFSSGTLPGGLSAATNYYVVPVTATGATQCLVKLAASHADAVAGAGIDLTDAGTGSAVVRKNAAPRYTCNGVVDTAVAPLENLNQLVSALAGAVTYVQGRFRAHAGAYDAPAGDVPTSALAGGLRLRARTPRKELFNGVKGTYVDPLKSWQPTDFPPVANAAYREQDNGEPVFKDLELPFTTDPERAQRIAKVVLEKARQGLVVDVSVNHAGLKYAAFDVVTLTNAQLGWSAKPFRVLKWTMQGAGPIGLTLQEESSASYDWNSGEATTIDPAPDTNLPDPLTVTPPGAPVVTEEIYVTADGTAAKSKAVVTWAASSDAFARDYQLEYRLTSATDYTVVGRTFGTTLEVLDIAPGSYDFRVKVYNNLGVSSAYSSTTAEIFGLTAPPADITNFSLNAIHNNAHLSWNQVADIDVRVGGSIRIRHTPELVSPSWSSAIDIGPALPGVASQAVLPLLNGTYMAKAVDSSGNESTTAAVIISTVANIVKMNRVAQRDEHPTFPDAGQAINLEVIDGALQLEGLNDFNDVSGLFDDAPGLFDGGAGSLFIDFGIYGFGFGVGSYSDPIDLGKVTTARVSANITATVFDPTATFDESDGTFDDRMSLFDGDDLTGIDVKLYIFTSDDGVTWSDSRQFFVGDYTARYFAFELRVSTASGTNTSLNISITELSVTVDVPDITDNGSLTTSASGVTTVTFAKDFYAAPDVGVTIQSATVGDQEILQNVTDTDFEVGVKDSGGSFVVRTISWAANGH